MWACSLLVSVGLLVVLLAGCSGGALVHRASIAALAPDAVWPYSAPGLSPDPEILCGRLSNGLKYVLKENKTPQDRVSMHLFVRCGSLAERDDERGMAHFLEHMLFNGSRNFAPGEMVKFFQRIGMQFGPDANAHTGFAQTVYDVVLPRGDAHSIGEGLLVLRDYADGALLGEEEIELERKVVLAEMRSRDSAAYRTFKRVLDFETPGSLLPQRLPIGVEDDLRRIDAEKMRAFYEAWYRPERMILVIVGDMRAAETVALIEANFGDMRPRGDVRVLPDLGRFEHAGVKAFYHFEKEVGHTKISLETVRRERRAADTLDLRRQELLTDLAFDMLQNRLTRLVRAPDSVMTSAGAFSYSFLQEIRFTEITADTRPANWRRTLALIEQELRKALTHGFTADELARVKKEMSATLRRAAEESNTRDSNGLARSIMDDLDGRRVIRSPRQELAAMAPLIEAAPLAAVEEAFRKSWADQQRLLVVTGNVDLQASAAEAAAMIVQAYQESQAAAVTAPPTEEAALFPYLPEPAAPGVIAARRQLPLAIEQVTFANGVDLLLKQTAFKEKEVLVTLAFGGGRSSQPPDQPGLADITGAVVNTSGFGGLDQDQLEEALAGRNVNIELEVREDMFVVRGEAVPAELTTLFQLLYTFVQDPGLRPAAYALAQKRLAQGLQAGLADVDGVMRIEGERWLAGQDTRFGRPAAEQYGQRTLAQIEAWFMPQLRTAPLEIALVGDIDKAAAIELAARYFGALAPRRPSPPAAVRPVDFPRGRSTTLHADSSLAKALLVTAYPTDDFWDVKRTRRLNVLAELLSERLRVRIREALGAVYSPFAYNRAYRGYPGYGVMQIYLNAAPADVTTLQAEVRRIVGDVVAKQIAAEEFQRVLDPILTGIKDLRQTNRYWLSSVLTGAGRHPQQIAWAQTMEQDYAGITSADLTTLARRYLTPEKAAVIVVLPRFP